MGAILWGLIGFFAGAFAGIVVELTIIKSKQKAKTSKTEVVIIVDCEKEQTVEVERILWKNKAFGISKSSQQGQLPAIT